MSAATNFWIRWRVRLGYPVALIYLALARPRPVLMVIGASIGVAGLAIRAWAAGHVRKHEALARSGPYAFTRNPLYFGSVILAVGFMVVGGSFWAAAVVAAYLAVFYPAVMRREESELRSRYGDAFAKYVAEVPLFWPRVGRSRYQNASCERFSGELYRRNREYQAFIGFVIAVAVLWAKMRFFSL